MIKTIFNKLYDLCRNTCVYSLCLHSIFVFIPLLIIRIFWAPIEVVMWISAAVILLRFLYLKMPNNVSSKIGNIKYDVIRNEHEKALKTIDKVLEKDMPKLKEKKKDEIYYNCIFYKGTSLAHLTYNHEKLEYAKKAVECLEEALELSLERKKNWDITFNMTNLATSYLCLGCLEHDTEHIKKSISLYENTLEYTKGKNFTAVIHSRVAYAYEALSKFCNKKENLLESLEELNTSYELCCNDDFSDSKVLIYCLLGTVLRKLYEIDCNEHYKTKAIKVLNETIDYCKSLKDKYSHKPQDDGYDFSIRHIGKCYFELYKLEQSEDYFKNCKEALKVAREHYTIEKSRKINNEINEMLMDLIEF